jgi:signal peptidase II
VHSLQGARRKDGPLIRVFARSRRVGAGVLVAVVGVDQALKLLVASTRHLGVSTSVLDGILSLTYVRNPGVAFGLLPQVPVLVPALIALTLLFLLFYNEARWVYQPRVQGALALLAGGAVGNLIDRLRLGAVVDYIDFHIWPVFNVADLAVTTGAALLVLSLVARPKPTAADLR